MKNVFYGNKRKLLILIHQKFKELEELLSHTPFMGIYEILCHLEIVLMEEEKKK